VTVPVALFAFNRPETTRRVLERICAAAPSELFLFADGPRVGEDGDVAACAEVRAMLDAVELDCPVHRVYSDVNHGIEGSIHRGLDRVFAMVDEAVILEDDCLPDPTFFEFSADLLERYRDDVRVTNIAGTGLHTSLDQAPPESYCFVAFSPIWGWATWRRSWTEYRSQEGGAPFDPDDTFLLTKAARRYFARVAERGLGDFGWDSMWACSTVARRGLAAAPMVNLVENIGIGDGATHTPDHREGRPALAMPMPIRHPAAVALDLQVELYAERILTLHGGMLAHVVRLLARSERARSVLRRARRLASRAYHPNRSGEEKAQELLRQ